MANRTVNIVTALLVLAFAVYLGFRDVRNLIAPLFDSQDSPTDLFTAERLKSYDGVVKPQLYLSIMGRIFDVTKGEKHYGTGRTYNFFVGRDATRSFVTGRFEVSDDPTEDFSDITGLSNDDLLSLDGWIRFYEKDYAQVGKLIGRYYNKRGKLTPYSEHIERLIRSAKKSKNEDSLRKVDFPPCNVEWTAEKGTRVWCSKRSGGIERNWIGVPRKLYEPGSSKHQCACVKEDATKSANLGEYKGCTPNHSSCFVID